MNQKTAKLKGITMNNELYYSEFKAKEITIKAYETMKGGDYLALSN